MPMVLHDYGDKGLVVMDGRRRVARAKAPARRGYPWVLRLYGGCWVNPAAREQQPSGLPSHKHPEYLTVRSKKEVWRELYGIVGKSS